MKLSNGSVCRVMRKSRLIHPETGNSSQQGGNEQCPLVSVDRTIGVRSMIPRTAKSKGAALIASTGHDDLPRVVSMPRASRTYTAVFLALTLDPIDRKCSPK